MDELTLENFRCFRERQTARLAPLTLLIGENSTGKTSMMALARILWDAVVFGTRHPNFKDEPYDLGSFREIVHQAEDDGGQTDFFTAGFGIGSWKGLATFEQGKISTEVRKLHFQKAGVSVEWSVLPDGTIRLEAKTGGGRWQRDVSANQERAPEIAVRVLSELWGPFSLIDPDKQSLRPALGSPTMSEDDSNELFEVGCFPFLKLRERHSKFDRHATPRAIAPVRSRSRRTYDPGPGFHDPEGAGVPAFLAALSLTDKEQWDRLKNVMETFGKQTGVFDELRIRRLGDEANSDPFQLQVRKHAGGSLGTWRNLVDVGYGVSQILPLFLEFTHPEATAMLQLQQPEVHLHPSAQAGLGSILCEVAASGRQLLVETHSDYLIDRIIMDVRDGKTSLKPEDVSLLFFERRDDEVRIHNVEIDRAGNIRNAPPGYRKFFKDEVNRRLGL